MGMACLAIAVSSSPSPVCYGVERELAEASAGSGPLEAIYVVLAVL